MPSYFTLRMQFGLHQDPQQVTAYLLKLAEQAPVDEIMLFMYGEELNNGHETLEEIQQWLDHTRPFRQAVAQAGVRFSLNPWITFLHADRGRKLKPNQQWQTMVDPHGRAAEAVVCPLDPGWREYYAAMLKLYAQEDFRVIWVEDDVRLHHHPPLHWGGCFCPLHLAEFNRRWGQQATREQIAAACTAAGEPHPWREQWLDMWDETQRELLAAWRDIVEARGVRLGLMSSSMEAHAAEGRRWEKWWEALASAQPPVHRPSFWGYSETLGSSLPAAIAMLEQNRLVQPAAVDSGPEIECFPYGQWNKSFRQIGAQTALSHVLGSTELNISIYDFMGNDPADEPQRADWLRYWRPVCDWLADEFPMDMRAVGVGVPWSLEMGRRVHTDGSGEWEGLQCPHRGWAEWLGAAGLAFTMRPQPTVNALAGPGVWSFSEEQLRAGLAGGLLLDAAAADILQQRGLGALIGLQQGRWITQRDCGYSIEHCLTEEFSLREGADLSLNAGPLGARLFQAELAQGARPVSDLRGPRLEVLGHGAVVYENELGGRVAWMPWEAHAGVMMNLVRATQLRKLVDYLGGGVALGRAEGSAWLVPQFLTNGERWRGVVWNAGSDAVEQMRVFPPAEMGGIGWAVQVSASGERRDAQIEGSRLSLCVPLHQWEFVVLG